MTAISADAAPEPLIPESLRRAWIAPAEGWTTLALVALMAFTVGWAIDDPRWVVGVDGYTDLLPWVAIGGVIAGFLGAKSGWPRWGAHLAGALAAALILPVLVGLVVVQGPADVGELFHATASSVVEAWIDLAIRNRALTPEFAHHVLVLAIICWGTGQYAAYATFGHRRPLDAVIVVGLVLLVNMAVTVNDQLGQLIVYTLASLFLLTRSHAFDEQTAWMRRRIGDPSAVRSLYLRGGTVFILLAVFGSIVLTASASSRPLAGLWAGVPARLVELSESLQRVLPVGGQSRSIGVAFGSSATISGVWSSNPAPALTIQLPADAPKGLYWRAVTYDTFNFNSWSWGSDRTIDRAAADPLLADTLDEPGTDGRRAVTFSVRRNGYEGSFIVSPQAPVSVDQDATVTLVGDDGTFGAVVLHGDSSEYTMTALVPVLGDDDPKGLTKNRLRAAGTDYPDEIKARYLSIPDGTLGPESLALLSEILKQSRQANPYDVAATMVSVFRDPAQFHYETNVQGVCGSLNVVECFARFRQGYCQYYASTMVMLLRQAGIPARIAEGFLPGERDAAGVETILVANAHAWVEVYFPGYGWVNFDPTGGGVAADPILPEGSPVAPRPTTALPSRSPGDGNNPANPDVTRRPVAGGGSTTGGNSQPPTPFIVVTILLAVIVGGLAFAAWQRGPSGATTPDAAWRGLTSLAGRFGFGPRPAQTAYEYAGTLGELLPGSRPELHTVAAAKVEVSYGRRTLSDDRLRTLRDAQRRLRVSLLRLAFRRKDRRRRRP